jgi:hypothetical protein
VITQLTRQARLYAPATSATIERTGFRVQSRGPGTLITEGPGVPSVPQSRGFGTILDREGNEMSSSLCDCSDSTTVGAGSKLGCR